MNRRLTHYDVLGVTRTATAAEIRTAYIGLMKQHHPDAIAKHADGRAASMAPLINRCYAVLREPGKRAEYDEQLALRSEVQTARQLARTAQIPPKPPTRSGSVLLALAACLVCAPLVMPLIAQSGAGPMGVGSFSWVGSRRTPTPANLVLSDPSSEHVRRQALIATSLNAVQAMKASQTCFANARQKATFKSAALCITFDEAFLYWRKAPGLAENLPAYFGDEMVGIREDSALSPFGADGEAKLGDIRRGAFVALLDLVNSSNSALASAQTATRIADDREATGATRLPAPPDVP